MAADIAGQGMAGDHLTVEVTAGDITNGSMDVCGSLCWVICVRL